MNRPNASNNGQMLDRWSLTVRLKNNLGSWKLEIEPPRHPNSRRQKMFAFKPINDHECVNMNYY